MPKSKKEEVQEQVVTPETTEDPDTQSKRSKRSKKEKKSKRKSRDQNTSETQDQTTVEETSSRKSKRSKKSKTETVESETVPTVEVDTTTKETTQDTSDNQDDSHFSETRDRTDELLRGLIESVQERIASDKVLLNSLRELSRHLFKERKDVGRVVKKLSKSQRKKRRGGNKSPGGFTKPAPLSTVMCTFLEVPEGTELPRTEVTRRVNTYVKANNLQNPENKKEILADDRLRTLLYLKSNDVLTYFNLQRFMKVHFLKKDPETGQVSTFTPPVLSQ